MRSNDWGSPGEVKKIARGVVVIVVDRLFARRSSAGATCTMIEYQVG